MGLPWEGPVPRGATQIAIDYGVMAWTLGHLAGVEPAAAYAAIREHITGAALITPAGTAAIMQSAWEDLHDDR